ncbi:class I SAM-dependent methyltransferase [Kocuria atrinae]|uniref:Methyltransferase domain-containing protein n=1 Tax=Kocuria atrinae TaxID=592377 RepID=A0ABN2Y1B1_9MICC
MTVITGDKITPSQAHEFLAVAAARLSLPLGEVCRVLDTPSDLRLTADQAVFQSIANLADELLRPRRYTPAIVDNFYVSARSGHAGEKSFVGGLEALRSHGYPLGAVESLPLQVTQRFLGLGNVWRGIDELGPIRFLDVGCGAGTDLGVAFYLSGGTSTVVGIDTRPDLLEFAATACPSALLAIGSVSKLPFAERYFDVVVANGLPPLQRPNTLAMSARQLCAVALPGGRVASSVLVAAPTLLRDLAGAFPAYGGVFVQSLATLATGKPTVEDVKSAFFAASADVEVHIGFNPYLDATDRAMTAMLEVVAIPQ